MGSWRRWLIVVLAGGLMVGCGGSGDSSADKGLDADKARATTSTELADTDEGLGDPIPDDPQPASGPTSEFTSVMDPVNGAFSVDVPIGWDNLVYSTVDGQVHTEVVNSVSPDGGTVIFIGDPKLPRYWNPDTADDVIRRMVEWVNTMELAPYSPAPEYFERYVRDKFGELDAFEITSIEPKPAIEQQLRDQLSSTGGPFQDASAVDVRFSFKDSEGAFTSALVSGITVDFGPSWFADLGGLATTGSVDDYTPMLASMSRSKATSPDFIAAQNQRNQQTLAMIQQRTDEMTRQHQANMAWIQDSANAHQQRMQSIWAAGDASVAGFYDRMSSGDVEHRQFLNSINEESTVQNADGKKFQVDNSYQRYWMNKSDSSYVGGDINFGDSQLSGLGLNPSDYEEVPVVKG